MKSRAKVLLVHGAFHGAWCWEHVALGLEARGVDVVAVDLPGHGNSEAPLAGLEEDAACVANAVAACEGDVVLCGHSYGGAVITEAASLNSHSIEHLVYVTAAVPDAGESLVDCFPGLLEAELEAGSFQSVPGSNSIKLDIELACERFYGDCSALLAEWAVAQLDAQAPESLFAKVSGAPWREIESTYVICTEDLVFPVGFQQRLAKRCHRSVEWASGHSPMLSCPAQVVQLLADLAR